VCCCVQMNSSRGDEMWTIGEEMLGLLVGEVVIGGKEGGRGGLGVAVGCWERGLGI
jgi:hypothetical protein